MYQFVVIRHEGFSVERFCTLNIAKAERRFSQLVEQASDDPQKIDQMIYFYGDDGMINAWTRP